MSSSNRRNTYSSQGRPGTSTGRRNQRENQRQQHSQKTEHEGGVLADPTFFAFALDDDLASDIRSMGALGGSKQTTRAKKGPKKMNNNATSRQPKKTSPLDKKLGNQNPSPLEEAKTRQSQPRKQQQASVSIGNGRQVAAQLRRKSQGTDHEKKSADDILDRLRGGPEQSSKRRRFTGLQRGNPIVPGSSSFGTQSIIQNLEPRHNPTSKKRKQRHATGNQMGSEPVVDLAMEEDQNSDAGSNHSQQTKPSSQKRGQNNNSSVAGKRQATTTSRTKQQSQPKNAQEGRVYMDSILGNIKKRSVCDGIVDDDEPSTPTKSEHSSELSTKTPPTIPFNGEEEHSSEDDERNIHRSLHEDEDEDDPVEYSDEDDDERPGKGKSSFLQVSNIRNQARKLPPPIVTMHRPGSEASPLESNSSSKAAAIKNRPGTPMNPPARSTQKSGRNQTKNGNKRPASVLDEESSAAVSGAASSKSTTKSRLEKENTGNGASLKLTKHNCDAAKQNGGAVNGRRKKAATAISVGSTLSPQQATGKRRSNYGTQGKNIVSKPRGGDREQRRSARSKPKPASNEVIELDLSDEEEDSPIKGDKKPCPSSQDDDNPNASTKRNTRSESKTVTLKVARIAVGARVLDIDCKIIFAKATLMLRGNDTNNTINKNHITKIDFTDDIDSVKEVKFFLGQGDADNPDESRGRKKQLPAFLSLRLTPTKVNDLGRFPNKYTNRTKDNKKKYVVVQFQSDTDLQKLLAGMKEQGNPYVCDGAQLLDASEAREYIGSLMPKRQRAKDSDGFIAGRQEDSVLLVYPFAGNPQEMEKVAAELPEASGSLFRESVAKEAALVNDDSHQLAGDDKPESRRHFLTVQVRDFERLNPGEFLNDTLIDFWIQWITRKADQDPLGSKVYCFSSHFFTTLADEGIEAVQRWTTRRKINVFEKKFVFIPINEALHWSLCVVVNPGFIDNDAEDAPKACLIFLDSLKAHSKRKVSKKVREWLDFEWKRIKKTDDTPFAKQKSFPLLDPKIPYQNNSWDCGVFVCRYAYSIYALRYREFLRNDPWFEKDLSCLDEFKFNMSDIRKLREDIRHLVQGLSRIYVPWKEDHDRQAKLDARNEKEARRKKLAAPDGGEGDASEEGKNGDRVPSRNDPPEAAAVEADFLNHAVEGDDNEGLECTEAEMDEKNDGRGQSNPTTATAEDNGLKPTAEMDDNEGSESPEPEAAMNETDAVVTEATHSTTAPETYDNDDVVVDEHRLSRVEPENFPTEDGTDDLVRTGEETHVLLGSPADEDAGHGILLKNGSTIAEHTAPDASSVASGDVEDADASSVETTAEQESDNSSGSGKENEVEIYSDAQPLHPVARSPGNLSSLKGEPPTDTI